MEMLNLLSQLQAPQPPQQAVVLLCPKHQEYVKGICLFNGYCPDRLICRTCRKFHDKNHLNNYEEIEDLIEGNLVNDILTNFEQVLKRLDHQIISYQKENEHAVTQIDNMFTQMQNYIIKKLNETRNLLIKQINTKIQAQVDLKNALVLQIREIDNQYQTARGSNFQPHYVIDNFLETITKAQNLKTSILNDPNLTAQPGSGLNLSLLSPAASANLVQFVMTFQDKVCADIVRSFSTPEKLAQSQGHFMTTAPRFDGTTTLPGASLGKNLAQGQFPSARSTFTGTPSNLFPAFPFRQEKTSVPGQPRTDFGTTFQPGATSSRGKNSGRRDVQGLDGAAMEEEKEYPLTTFKPHHTPHKLLEIIKAVDQEDKLEKRGPGRSMDKGAGRGREHHSLDSREMKSGQQYQRRNKSEDQRNRHVNAFVYKTTLNTEHRQIMFGGLAYVPSRNQLIASGTDGWIELWDTKSRNKKKVRALNNDIFKIKYIAEKDMLLAAGVDGLVSVLRFNKSKDSLDFLVNFKKHQGPVFALEYLPDWNVVVSGGEDEHLRIWKTETGEEMYALKTSGTKIGSLCLLKRINRVAVGFDKGHINVTELSQKIRKVHYTIKAHSNYVLNLVSIEDRNLLVSGGDDGFIKVWRVLDKHQLLFTMKEPKTTVRGLAVFSDQDLILSNHDDKQVRLWRLSDGAHLRTHRDQSFGESIVAIGDKEYATGSAKQVKVWSLV